MSFSKNLCLAYQNKLGQKKSEFGRIKEKLLPKYWTAFAQDNSLGYWKPFGC